MEWVDFWFMQCGSCAGIARKTNKVLAYDSEIEFT